MSKARIVKLFALFLTLVFLIPTTTFAAEPEQLMPRASYYLMGYQTYVCPVGNGEVQVWYDVIGAGTQDELGTLRIMIYESSDNQNFTWKKTFLHEDYSSMLAYNTSSHMSYVSYQGTAGKYYKAYVCIWGGKDGKGDTRYLWTSARVAT